MRSNQNALIHGIYTRAAKDEAKELNGLLRQYKDLLRTISGR